MLTLQNRLQRFAATVVLCAVAACGGGGGDEPLLPTLSQDSVPAGSRIDVSAFNLFPTGFGDRWVYDRSPALDSSGTVTRSVVIGPDANGFVVLRETDAGRDSDIVQRPNTAGLEQYDLLGVESVWPGVFAALPTFIEYPTPLYPIGGERRTIRQGSFGADVDGDGRHDYFRLEIVQVFRGFEEMQVLGQTVDAAHFSNVIAFTSAVTSNGARFTTTSTEETYFAGNVGLVRADRAASGSDGRVLVAPYSITLRSATVNGLNYGVATGSGALAPQERVAAIAARGAANANASWLRSAIELAQETRVPSP